MPRFKCTVCGMNEIEARVARCRFSPCPMDEENPGGALGIVLVCAFATLTLIVVIASIWWGHS